MRAEFEVLFEPDMTPNLTFFVGLGTRFWVRDLVDDFTASGVFVPGYQETWWTFYPYVGMERRRNLSKGWELYGMGRIGLTAITLEQSSGGLARIYPTGQYVGDYGITLYPEPSI